MTKNGIHDDLKPVHSAFVGLLKTCTQSKDLLRGTRLHADILRRGLLEKNPFIASTLVSMYAKCGELAKAQHLLDELPVRDVVSWSALIAGYAQHGQAERAVTCFEQMQLEGLFPNSVTYIAVLKACGSLELGHKGEKLHDEIVHRGLLREDSRLASSLVDMYVKCSMFAKAQHVLDELPVHNVVLWNALISGYAHAGRGKEAFCCYEQMQCETISPDAITFACMLKSCSSMGVLDKGKQIHDEILCQGLLGKSVFLDTALVEMYIECGALAKAQEVLQHLPLHRVPCWSVLIAGYANQDMGKEALSCFEKMKHEGLSPDTVTFISVLKACGSIRAIDMGYQIHEEIICQSMVLEDIALGTALVDMYVKCGELTRAQQVHDEIPMRNVTSWSALIAGFVQQGKCKEAWDCYKQMRSEGISANAVTLSSLLRACGSMRALDKGKKIHDDIVRQGFLGKDTVLGNALVDMYVKCSALSKAQQVLSDLPDWDVVSWSSLIAGYAQQELGEIALDYFEKMKHEGLSPNIITYICTLKACGGIGTADKGKEIHNDIISQGLLERSVELGNSLVDMYAKCGILEAAAQVLDDLPERNVASFNALIAGYAQHLQDDRALICFDHMQSEGFYPDSVTFTCILNACSRSGLLGKAELYFSTMNMKYDILPTLEHLTCMVDLFCRIGHVDKALLIIKKVQSFHDSAVWSALLGACAKWENVKVGRWAFEHAVHTDDMDAFSYVSMARIYVASGVHEMRQWN